MSEFWNSRYNNETYIYGEQPNAFLAEQLSSLQAGRILFPCEGEGRNAVYAATQGWETMAFDSSTAGRQKALQLADKKGVHITYDITDATQATYPEGHFDVIALIFAHVTPDIRPDIHSQCITWLKPGGTLILEAFHPTQLGKSSGGPKDLQLLFDEQQLASDFASLQCMQLEVASVELSEGTHHIGMASVIRYVGRKK